MIIILSIDRAGFFPIWSSLIWPFRIKVNANRCFPGDVIKILKSKSQAPLSFYRYEVEEDLGRNLFLVSSCVVSFVSEIQHFEFANCHLAWHHITNLFGWRKCLSLRNLSSLSLSFTLGDVLIHISLFICCEIVKTIYYRLYTWWGENHIFLYRY